MKELEIGMYCYNKTNRKFGIGKIIEIRQHNNYVIEYKNGIALVSSGNIIVSHNIIDLIEVGDYVNDELITDITGEYIRIGDVSHNKSWLSNNIKTILTKEQMENYCYKIRDEK